MNSESNDVRRNLLSKFAPLARIVTILAATAWVACILAQSVVSRTVAQEAPAPGEQAQAVAPAPAAPAAPAAAAPIADPAPIPGAKTRTGKLVRIGLPLDNGDDLRLRSIIDRTIEPLTQQTPRHVLVLEFYVKPTAEPAKREEFAQSSKFGPAYELARYLSDLSKVQKVAYIPQMATGHAVLVAMACDEIFMTADATIGKAGVAEEAVVDPVRRSGYDVIYKRRKTIPWAIALGMLDKDAIVYRVDSPTGRDFVLGADLEEYRKTHLVKGEPSIIVERGQFGLFKGSEGRSLGFVKFLPRNREHLATELELPPDALVEDPSLGKEWQTLQVSLTGPITQHVVSRAQESIQDEIGKRNVNFIVVRIESAGGDPKHPEFAVDMANFLADFNSGEVRTVAYIAQEAKGDAAIVAAACDHIVMCPDAVLGGSGEFEIESDSLDLIVQTIRRSIAPAKGRSWSLMAALVDPRIELYRYTRQGDLNTLVEYFTAEEATEREKADGQIWQRGDLVKRAGETLELTSADAKKYGLVTHIVDDFNGLKEAYHISEDPVEIKPKWARRLIEALAQPALAWILLALGFGAMYIEMHTPGVGIAGFISGICFLVYFWAQFLNGTAEWLEVLLFVGGLLCVMLELLVIPGFGIFGFGGAVMMLASLILVSQTFIFPHNEYEIQQFQNSLMVVGLGVAGCVGIAIAIRQFLPRAPFFNRVVLLPPGGEQLLAQQEREAMLDLGFLVGHLGYTTTPLSPAGIARFDDEVIHVVSDGDFVPRGAEVIVAEVHGNRVVVRLADR